MSPRDSMYIYFFFKKTRQDLVQTPGGLQILEQGELWSPVKKQNKNKTVELFQIYQPDAAASQSEKFYGLLHQMLHLGQAEQGQNIHQCQQFLKYHL